MRAAWPSSMKGRPRSKAIGPTSAGPNRPGPEEPASAHFTVDALDEPHPDSVAGHGPRQERPAGDGEGERAAAAEEQQLEDGATPAAVGDPENLAASAAESVDGRAGPAAEVSSAPEREHGSAPVLEPPPELEDDSGRAKAGDEFEPEQHLGSGETSAPESLEGPERDVALALPEAEAAETWLGLSVCHLPEVLVAQTGLPLAV